MKIKEAFTDEMYISLEENRRKDPDLRIVHGWVTNYVREELQHVKGLPQTGLVRFLSQLTYWFCERSKGKPKTHGAQHTRARAVMHGKRWVAKTVDEWCYELANVRPTTFRKIVRKLCEIGLLEKGAGKFGKDKKMYLRFRTENVGLVYKRYAKIGSQNKDKKPNQRGDTIVSESDTLKCPNRTHIVSESDTSLLHRLDKGLTQKELKDIPDGISIGWDGMERTSGSPGLRPSAPSVLNFLQTLEPLPLKPNDRSTKDLVEHLGDRLVINFLSPGSTKSNELIKLRELYIDTGVLSPELMELFLFCRTVKTVPVPHRFQTWPAFLYGIKQAIQPEDDTDVSFFDGIMSWVIHPNIPGSVSLDLFRASLHIPGFEDFSRVYLGESGSRDFIINKFKALCPTEA